MYVKCVCVCVLDKNKIKQLITNIDLMRRRL